MNDVVDHLAPALVGNECAIPESAILLLEHEQPAVSTGPRRDARSLEQHQRQERMRLRHGGGGMAGNETRQAENQTYNTAVWQNNSCGGSNSEWMHCGGAIGFGNTP